MQAPERLRTGRSRPLLETAGQLRLSDVRPDADVAMSEAIRTLALASGNSEAAILKGVPFLRGDAQWITRGEAARLLDAVPKPR